MDSKELGDALLGLSNEKRDKWFALMKDPVFVPRYNYESWEETRDHPERKLRAVIDAKMVSVTDFGTDPHNIYAAHEFLGMMDGSLAIKFTVQFNLFGGSIFALCTERHHHLFKKIDDLSVFGCFGLTELGFGANTVKMETTAHYDEKTQEFIIHSPTVLSQKYWISNGYKHANNSLVFAQTIVKGKNEGVNAFLVPTRDTKTHEPLPGVTIVEMGHKMGLNGVDNAALKYNKVRIPRENMMNRYADVSPEGNFTSDVKGVPQRFFKVTERLLSGRLCIAAMAIGAQKACLMIAIRYAQQRLSIGITGKSTEPIFSYQLQQNALMPLVARSMALNVMYNRTRNIYKDPKGYEHELLSRCCITKTMLSWNLMKVASVCRERCGGMGYLAVAKFGDYLATSHAAVTAEGDNRVLMTKIFKDYMTNVKLHGFKVPEPTLHAQNQIGTMMDVTQVEVLADLLRFREKTQYHELMKKMAFHGKNGKKTFQILMREVADQIQDMSMSYGERNTIEANLDFINNLKNGENKRVMTIAAQIFAIDIIKNDLGFFMARGAINKQAAAHMVSHQNQLIKQMAKNIDGILDSFNVPFESLHCPIAQDYEKYYSKPNFGEVTDIPSARL